MAHGNEVVTFWTARGTQSGPYLGIAATGKVVESKTAIYRRFSKGQVVEDRTIFDRLSVLQQLGRAQR